MEPWLKNDCILKPIFFYTFALQPTGMQRSITILLIFYFAVCFSSEIQAQSCILQGKVSDEQTNEPLPFVNIGIKGSHTGTFSDNSGLYQLELPKGEYTLLISCVGYDKQERHLYTDSKSKIVLNIELAPTSLELNTLVVSGSKYEQKVENSIATIEVLKSKAISVSNPSSIDKVIDKIPGITIVNNEPQIRGGSGFSSGLGSRVMIMVDDIPILRGDAGRPDWGFLPVDDVEQIEVVKGASSVVYGSSAITGAINIRTAYPKDKPESTLNTFFGVYSKPDRTYATPWTGMNPVIYGIAVTHLQKFNNIDLGFGVNYYDDQGYIRGSPEQAKDTNFNKGQFERRAKVYFNTRIRNKKIEGLTYGINGNFMFSDKAEAYFWFDADTNQYRSYPGSLSHFKEFTFFVDPFIKYYNKNGNSHTLKNRIYYGNTDANNNQSNRYLTVYNEYQHTHKFQKLGDLMLVVGITNIYSHSYGKVFSGKLAADSTTTANQNAEFSAENLAVYAQLEKKFFKRLTILAGGRWEYYQIASLSENKPIFRAGLNLEITKATFLRASVGQGYRAPSIGERYITTNSGGFGFYPNPDLKSETCLSYELGIKQMFRIGKFQGMADVSGFLENYKNYVEFNFGEWGASGLFSKNIGFKFLNTGPARIYGIDMTLGGEGKLVRNLELSTLIGYTYCVPIALDTAYIYYSQNGHLTGHLNYSYNSTSTDPSQRILKYRIQHLFKSDVQFTYKKKIALGFTGRYYSFMKNIDNFLTSSVEKIMNSGIKEYRATHNKGNFIVDMRLSYSFRDFKFSFLVNNCFNTEYSLRPITIEAPRTTSLQVLLHI
jgi:iron complex outermembrane receptor protein